MNVGEQFSEVTDLGYSFVGQRLALTNSVFGWKIGQRTGSLPYSVADLNEVGALLVDVGEQFSEVTDLGYSFVGQRLALTNSVFVWEIGNRSADQITAVFGILCCWPSFGRPEFRYTGCDPNRDVWQFGWPLATLIVDPNAASLINIGPLAYIYCALFAITLAWYGVVVMAVYFGRSAAPR
jgi:hypothetical protein